MTYQNLNNQANRLKGFYLSLALKLVFFSIFAFVGCSGEKNTLSSTVIGGKSDSSNNVNSTKGTKDPSNSKNTHSSGKTNQNITFPQSNSVPNGPPPPLPRHFYDWKFGDFPDNVDGTHLNRCVFPRFENNNKGSYLDELFSVRHIVKRRYILWENSNDVDPRKFIKGAKNPEEHYINMTDQNSYLAQLRSTVRKPDGDIEREMFKTYNSDLFGKNSGVYTYGVNWRVISDKPPRDYQIEFKKTGFPTPLLSDEGIKIKRGDKLLKLNGVDVINSNDSLLEDDLQTLVRPRKNTKSRIVLLDRDGITKKTITLSSIEDNSTNLFSSTIDTFNGRVGYIFIEDLVYQADRLQEIFAKFKKDKIVDLVLDMRYLRDREIRSENNKTGSALAFMVAGKERTVSKLYTYQSGKSVHRFRVPFFRSCLAVRLLGDLKCAYGIYRPPVEWDESTIIGWAAFFEEKPFVSLDFGKVYILTSRNTCNIGEIFINGLRGIDLDVILIGERTCGNPFDSSLYENCGILFSVIDTRYKNNNEFGEYEYGFKPTNSKDKNGVNVKGCFVDNVLTKELGDPTEPLLAAALQYRQNSTCPSVP